MSRYDLIYKKSSDYYDLVSLSYIKQISKGKWRVYSKSGRNMGTFSSKKKAKERLRQIEYFKKINKNAESNQEIIDLSRIDELSYSCIVRELRKKYGQDITLEFISDFKGVFDTLLLITDSDVCDSALKYALMLFSTKRAVKLPEQKRHGLYKQNISDISNG